MSLVFAGGEASALQPFGTPAEVTTGSSFRSANSRVALGSTTPVNYWTGTVDTAIVDGSFKCQWWTNFVDTDDSAYFIELQNTGGTGQIRLNCGSNGTVMGLQYWNGSTWVQVGSNFNPGVYSSVMVEIIIKFTCGASGTNAELFFNGVSKASGSIGSATTSIKRCVLLCPDANAQWNFSEVLFYDGTDSIIGSVMETEAPTGNGADSTDGTGAYTDIDEGITTDTDKITLTAAGQHRSFTSPARTSTLSEVLGVGVSARANRGSTGPSKMKFYLTISGTRYYSPDITLALGYSAYQYVWPTNPATGLAWSTTDANAATLEWGIEAVT